MVACHESQDFYEKHSKCDYFLTNLINSHQIQSGKNFLSRKLIIHSSTTKSKYLSCLGVIYLKVCMFGYVFVYVCVSVCLQSYKIVILLHIQTCIVRFLTQCYKIKLCLKLISLNNIILMVSLKPTCMIKHCNLNGIRHLVNFNFLAL